MTDRIEELEAENERLEKRVSDDDECIMEQEDEIESLRVENEKLRGALKWYMEYSHYGKIAEEALAEKDK